MEKTITYFGQDAKVSCDEKCEKAWGNKRPTEQLSKNPDDYVWLSDNELGIAPVDTGTREGLEGKPVNKQGIPNKWCVRECERCVLSKPGESTEPANLRDWSKRRYNMPWLHKESKTNP